MTLALKANVKFKDPSLMMAIANQVVEGCFTTMGSACTITSGNDSNHGPKSLHYSDRAIDYRTHTVPPEKLDKLVSLIRTRLTKDFDVVLEDRGKPNSHIHLELDPK